MYIKVVLFIFSQRLREMSESLKNTYGDDNLNKSPHHILFSPLYHIDIDQEKSSLNVEPDKIQKIDSPTTNKVISGGSILGSFNTNTSTSVVKNKNEDTIAYIDKNSFDVCDTGANQATIESLAHRDNLESVFKANDADNSKTRSFPGETKGSSVTIPRIQKPHQSNIRKSMRIHDANVSSVLSRSYQQPSSLDYDRNNPISNFERHGVSMRRSSSVPCKRITVERGSSSSSDDSGFSPGSPNTSALLANINLEQAVKSINLNGGHEIVKTSNVPNKEAQTDLTEVSATTIQ